MKGGKGDWKSYTIILRSLHEIGVGIVDGRERSKWSQHLDPRNNASIKSCNRRNIRAKQVFPLNFPENLSVAASATAPMGDVPRHTAPLYFLEIKWEGKYNERR